MLLKEQRPARRKDIEQAFPILKPIFSQLLKMIRITAVLADRLVQIFLYAFLNAGADAVQFSLR